MTLQSLLALLACPHPHGATPRPTIKTQSFFFRKRLDRRQLKRFTRSTKQQTQWGNQEIQQHIHQFSLFILMQVETSQGVHTQQNFFLTNIVTAYIGPAVRTYRLPDMILSVNTSLLIIVPTSPKLTPCSAVRWKYSEKTHTQARAHLPSWLAHCLLCRSHISSTQN